MQNATELGITAPAATPVLPRYPKAPPRASDLDEMRAYVAALGPTPKPALRALVDLGLSDAEIARYHRIPQICVSKMRRIWGIRRPD